MEVEEDQADEDFVAISDTTPSSPGSGSASVSDSGSCSTNGWARRKWIVDEANPMELFRTCSRCGVAIEEKQTAARACQIKVYWTRLNGHSGEWASCPDQRSA